MLFIWYFVYSGKHFECGLVWWFGIQTPGFVIKPKETMQGMCQNLSLPQCLLSCRIPFNIAPKYVL